MTVDQQQSNDNTLMTDDDRLIASIDEAIKEAGLSRAGINKRDGSIPSSQFQKRYLDSVSVADIQRLICQTRAVEHGFIKFTKTKSGKSMTLYFASASPHRS
jgi:hypothetical protein